MYKTIRTKKNFFFFCCQAEDGIRDYKVTGVQTCLFRSMLSHWNAGKPRLTTAHDFHAVDDAFRAQNLPTPTMGDYENAMGFSKMPEWRTALRYQELARFYQDGVVAD